MRPSLLSRQAIAVFVAVCGVLLGPAAAASEVVLASKAERIDLTTAVLVLEDKDRALTIEQVAGRDERDFRPVGGNVLALGYTRSATWARVTLKNAEPTTERWFLEVNYPLVHEVTFFMPSADGGWQTTPMGLSLPFDQRVVRAPTFLVPVEVRANETVTCYVRLAGEYSLAIPFVLHRASALGVHLARREIAAGFYYGIVVIMILYNLLLYVQLRDRNYAYYVVTLVFLHLLYQATFLGHYYQLELGGQWFASRALPFFVFLGIAFGVHFSRVFNRSKELMPRWDKLLLGMVVVTGLLAPLSLAIPTSIADQLCITGGALAAILLIATGALAWRRGYAAARYFLLAWSAILVGDIVYTLKIAQIVPDIFLTSHALQIGSALEVFLLSLALGDRITLLRREKEAAQQAALEKQREAAAAQAELVANLQRMDKLKDEILANTSHELRTPLNGITGLAEAMLDGASGQLPAPANKNLSIIVAAARRLTSLVNDILDFAKLKQDKLSVNVEPVDLREVTDAVLALSASLVGKKALTLKSTLPESLPAVQADPNRLQQILQNLVGNAIKFTPEGHVEVSARVDAGKLEVSVTDTGIGISPENQERVFDAFEQADGSTAREYGGTGLGLAVTRKLVELQGGRIGLRSTPGKGSTFYFTLPVSTDKPAARRVAEQIGRVTLAPEEVAAPPTPVVPAAAAAAPTKIAPPAPRLPTAAATPHTPGSSRGRILVVDDEPINQAVLANILAHEQYEISQALNGFEALSALEKNGPFDLVLLDVMMPRMSGYEVCRTIRQQQGISQLPVLMLTAKTQVTDLVEGFNAGANDYVTKPFSKQEILARIRTHLQLSQMTAAAGRFVPYEFLSYLKKQSLVDVKLGDQVRQTMTVLFSDIRSYTTISEQLTPEENFRFLNRYFGEMAPIIGANHGFIDKYVGDAIMALFDRDPVDAVRAAVDMQLKLRELNGQRKDSGLPMLAAGVGINTGSLMLGTIGHADRLQSTVLSDAVNIAARLEALSKVFRAAIIIGADTYQGMAAGERQKVRCLGRVRVKGKAHPVAIYEVFAGYVPEVIELRRRTLDDFEKAVELWQRNDLAGCEGLVRRVLEVNKDDQAAVLYLHRCALARGREADRVTFQDPELDLQVALLA